MVPLIIAGAAASLAGSGIQAYSQYKANEEALEAKKKAANQLYAQGQLTDNEYKKVIQNIEDYYAQRGSLGQESDVEAYRKAVRSFNPEDYVDSTSSTSFEDTFNKTKDDFVNPYYSQIMADTTSQLQHTAAGAGLGRGTGAALNIAKGVTEKSDELYRTAMQDYQNERNFAYQKYQDAITNNQNRLNSLLGAKTTQMQMQGNLANDYYDVMDQAQADRIAAEQDRLNAKTSYSTAMAGLY
jgi:hypothetical protein